MWLKEEEDTMQKDLKMCNQIPVKIKNSRANFSSKMSKLFG